MKIIHHHSFHRFDLVKVLAKCPTQLAWEKKLYLAECDKINEKQRQLLDKVAEDVQSQKPAIAPWIWGGYWDDAKIAIENYHQTAQPDRKKNFIAGESNVKSKYRPLYRWVYNRVESLDLTAESLPAYFDKLKELKPTIDLGDQGSTFIMLISCCAHDKFWIVIVKRMTDLKYYAPGSFPWLVSSRAQAAG
ncbi:unnamed protein product [Amoebophrya sp. A120]|nr:unnamed protein product [Amoebophrya sp. A120]|eukprot:GSA120T00020936001.1